MKLSIVTFFDRALTERIVKIQERLTELTGSKACLDLWKPHMTVGSGMIIKNTELQGIIEQVKSAIYGTGLVEIELKDFGFMDDWPGAKRPGNTPYVAYIDVVPNKKLTALASDIKKVTDQHERFYDQPWPYLPHVTVAYKDLSKDGLKKAKTVLKNEIFEAKTSIGHISIMKKNDDGTWIELESISLS